MEAGLAIVQERGGGRACNSACSVKREVEAGLEIVPAAQESSLEQCFGKLALGPLEVQTKVIQT